MAPEASGVHRRRRGFADHEARAPELASEQSAPFDLVLASGRVLDERNGIDLVADLAIRDGRIAAVGPGLAATAKEVVDVRGALIVPGLIDVHAHVFHKATSLGVDPDRIARRSALSTIVDAGSAGAGNFDGFRDFVMARSPYRILAFLNISFAGIFAFDHGLFVGEATQAALLPVDRCVAKIEANRDRLVGVKVRIGGPATGALGMEALELAIQAAEQVGLPIMAHIGRAPPSYGELVDRLRPGDILSHCYRPGPNCLLDASGKLLPEVRAARDRGVLFDVAHGMGAFGFDVVGRALDLGFEPDLISSDVHVVCVDGPAYDLLHTMSKLLGLGVPIESVVAMSANRPARAIGRPELGHLGVGAPADVTVLDVVDADIAFTDVHGNSRKGTRLIRALNAFNAGREVELSRRPFEDRFCSDDGGATARKQGGAGEASALRAT